MRSNSGSDASRGEALSAFLFVCPYSVVGADTIHVLRQGCIVEYGTHTELLACQGYYAGLAARQGMQVGDREEGAEINSDGPTSRGCTKGLQNSVLRQGSARLSFIPQVR